MMDPQPAGRIVDLPETQSAERSGEPPGMHPTRLAPARGLIEGVQTWSGTLIDAGCRYRDSYVLQMPAPVNIPQPAPQATERQAGAAGSSLVPEEVTQNMTPDVAARQTDMSCGITGGTTAFSILLDNGQLKDLDEGGNTYAWDAVGATPEGQAVMAGKLRAVKPRAVLRGTLRNDEIIVESMRLEQGQARSAPAPEQKAPPRQP